MTKRQLTDEELERFRESGRRGAQLRVTPIPAPAREARANARERRKAKLAAIGSITERLREIAESPDTKAGVLALLAELEA